jgi:hypothetical protein
MGVDQQAPLNHFPQHVQISGLELMGAGRFPPRNASFRTRIARPLYAFIARALP